MTGRTHDAMAFASLVTIAALFPPQSLKLTTLAVSIIGTDIGALLPDIDQAGNRLWDLLPSGHILGRIFRRVFYKLLEWILPKFLNSGFLDSRVVLAAIMIGYISHLVADSFTEEGLPLLFPINITFGIPPIRRVRIKTGKWFENLVVYPGIWIYLVWFIHTNQEKLIRILRLTG